MEKKKNEGMEMEIVAFEAEDVITASAVQACPFVTNCPDVVCVQTPG